MQTWDTGRADRLTQLHLPGHDAGQADAAVQYAFGREGEARSPGYAIRSGQESRSEFFGHVNLLGPSRLLRPVSVGMMYANTPESYPFPNRVFADGSALGATVGSALTATLAGWLSPSLLLVAAALLLEVAVFCVFRLARLSSALHMPVPSLPLLAKIFAAPAGTLFG